MKNNTEPDKFDTAVHAVNAFIIKFLIVVLTICLILSSLDLVKIIYQKVATPPYPLIDISALFEIFTLVLVIAIGYELIKSFNKLISSDIIPVLPIIQISVIAIANKIITLDTKHTDSGILFGLAAILAGLGVAFYLLKDHSIKNEK